MLKKTLLTTSILGLSCLSFANEYIADIESRNDKVYSNNFSYEYVDIDNEDTLDIMPYVVDGANASISNYPFYARLIIPVSNSSFYHTCGASILNSNYLLTAAHCVYGVDISQYAAVINKDDNYFSMEDVLTFSDVYLHPNYSYTTYDHDIAILKLDSPITESFTPISIASENEVDYYSTLSEFTIVGMGQINRDNENPVSASRLQYGNVKTLYDENCTQYISQSAENVVCAEPQNGTDSCFGDSGGPLVYEGNNGSRQAALVSYGATTTGVCGTDGFTVYTEVAGYADWIEEITGIQRDANGINDTDPDSVIRSSDGGYSGGSIGWLTGLILCGLAYIRRRK